MLESFERRRPAPSVPSSLSAFSPFADSPVPSSPSPRFHRRLPVALLPSGTRDGPV